MIDRRVRLGRQHQRTQASVGALPRKDAGQTRSPHHPHLPQLLRAVVVVGAARAHIRERSALARLRVHWAVADVVEASLRVRVDALAGAVLARNRLERLRGFDVAVGRAAVATARVVAIILGAVAILCLAAAHVGTLAVWAGAVRFRGDLARVCGQVRNLIGARSKRKEGERKVREQWSRETCNIYPLSNGGKKDMVRTR